VGSDVIVIGTGVAGLAAAGELVAAGRSVLLIDRAPARAIGGQARHALGAIFLVDSPEQRRSRVEDSLELAWADWLGSAGFDRAEDRWPLRAAQRYVEWSAVEARSWLYEHGVRFLPSPLWTERGGGDAQGHGNSVPRLHLIWGAGPALVQPFVEGLRRGPGRVRIAHRRRVTELLYDGGELAGVAGEVLDPEREEAVGEFVSRAPAVVLAGGGIGGNRGLIREHWPARLGPAPGRMLAGTDADGSLLALAQAAGGQWINRDRMWLYPNGIPEPGPQWPDHGLVFESSPSPLWFDAGGQRLPAPLFPGHDTLATLAHLRRSGHDHSWLVLNQRIAERELLPVAAAHNPEIAGRSVPEVVRQRLLASPARSLEDLFARSPEVLSAAAVDELVARMNELAGTPVLDSAGLERQIIARDRQVQNAFGKDFQLMAIRAGRRYLPDRAQRIAPLHRILDPESGPLLAIRLQTVAHSCLGGVHCDLDGRVLDKRGDPLPGLFACGELAGFGGGGMHGHRALGGTFLGGALFSGRAAGLALAAAL
jgi:predicted oxidoreductase